MWAFVFVEGPSDKLAMEALLKPIIEQKALSDIYIQFIVAQNGDRKEDVLTHPTARSEYPQK